MYRTIGRHVLDFQSPECMQHQIEGYARVEVYEDRSCMTAITACWCETLRKERDWRTRLSLLRGRRVEGCFYTETP